MQIKQDFKDYLITNHMCNSNEEMQKNMSWIIMNYVENFNNQKQYQCARDFYFETKEYFSKIAADRINSKYEALFFTKKFATNEQIHASRIAVNEILHQLKDNFIFENELDAIETEVINANLTSNRSMILFINFLVFQFLEKNNLIFLQ